MQDPMQPASIDGDLTPRPAREQWVGGKYRLIRPLGEGGCGRVVLARQVEKGVDLGAVVLKFLWRDRSREASNWQRITDEIRAAREVNSPHAVKIYGSGEDDEGIPFIVMEYLEGRTLREVISTDGPLDPGRTLTLGRQVASALEACHERGILHLDLKPENLLLQGKQEDFVKVIDFGIARREEGKDPGADEVAGTPTYSAPEQLRGEQLDEGADIFALGVVLHECLTGHTPTEGDGTSSLALLHPGVPRQLTDLLQQLLSPDRAARPASMADLERRLEMVQRGGGWGAAALSGPVTGEVLARTIPLPEGRRPDLAAPRRRFTITTAWPWLVLLAILSAMGLAGARFRPWSTPATHSPRADEATEATTLPAARAPGIVAGAPGRAAEPVLNLDRRPPRVPEKTGAHVRRPRADKTPSPAAPPAPRVQRVGRGRSAGEPLFSSHDEPIFPAPPPLKGAGALDRYGKPAGGL